jgi:hypothetical protein
MKPAKDIKRLINNLHDKTSAQMDERVLKDVLFALEESGKISAPIKPNIRRIIMKSPITKIAAMITLICMGVAAATVVGIKIHKWRFVGKHPKAGYLLSSEDGLKGRTIPESWAESPERAVEVAEELDLLKQQGAGELVSVVEKEVNGKLISRVFISKYVLADGREIKSSDRDPDFNEQLTEAQNEELFNLLRADEYVTIGFEEKEFRGRMFTFERNRFILSDGTEVIWSVGRPSEERQDTVRTVVRDPKEAEQIIKEKREIANLRQQGKRQLIGVKELKANGELDFRVFVYQYKLSDGRTRDTSEDGTVNNVLNKEQIQEWRQCKNKGSGEDLGTYEQKVKDRLFVFKKQKFILSDGTEIIWSYGTLKDGQ